MKTLSFVLLFLIVSLIAVSQTKTDINCKIWKPNDYCDMPDSIISLDRLAAINCQEGYTDCKSLDSLKTMTGVWLSFYNKKGSKINFKSDFANIRLIKKDSGKSINPYAFHKANKYFIVYLKATKYTCHIKGKRKVDFFMLFTEAETGDKIIIDDFIEATIQ